MSKKVMSVVVVVCISVLIAVSAQPFIHAQDHARITAAKADLDQFRQALGMFEIDNADYPTAMTLANAVSILVDPQGNPYMELPNGDNFASFTFTYDGSVSPTTYSIDVTCVDKAGSTLTATPNGVVVN